MVIRGSILTHPNIPKPLHGVAPRVIKGEEWWERTRQAVYELYRFRCSACGIHRDKAAYHAWLEAHECYSVNYETGRVQLSEIVGLCHACHNFIHCGRMTALWQKGDLDTEKVRFILKRGFKILKRLDLKPNPVAARLWFMIQGQSVEQAQESVRATGLDVKMDPWKAVPWEKWHLLFEGKKYYSRFKNEEEWRKHYGG